VAFMWVGPLAGNGKGESVARPARHRSGRTLLSTLRGSVTDSSGGPDPTGARLTATPASR